MKTDIKAVRIDVNYDENGQLNMTGATVTLKLSEFSATTAERGIKELKSFLNKLEQPEVSV